MTGKLWLGAGVQNHRRIKPMFLVRDSREAVKALAFK